MRERVSSAWAAHNRSHVARQPPLPQYRTLGGSRSCRTDPPRPCSSSPRSTPSGGAALRRVQPSKPALWALWGRRRREAELFASMHGLHKPTGFPSRGTADIGRVGGRSVYPLVHSGGKDPRLALSPAPPRLTGRMLSIRRNWLEGVRI